MIDSRNAAGGSASPGHDGQVALYLAVQAFAWFAWTGLMHSGAPGDNIEQLNWAHGFEFGYFKHPPFATWLLFPLQSVLGPHLWVTRILGQTCVAVALWLIWRAMRCIVSREAAFVGLVIGSCITYFSSRGHVYNHNTAMLVPLALALLMSMSLICDAHRAPDAAARTSIRHWAMLGAAFGTGAMVKYQMALFAGSFGMALILCGAMRDAKAWRGAALACAVALAIFAPHVFWLLKHDFAPFHYASGSLAAALDAGRRLTVSLQFVAQQVGRFLPALAVVGVALVLRTGFARRSVGLRAGPSSGGGAEAASEIAGRSAVRIPDRCLILLCLGPAVLTVAICVVFGVRLQNHWGTGALLAVVPLIGAWVERRKDAWELGAADRRSLLFAALVIQGLVAGTQLLPARGGSSGVAHDYVAYPSASLAREALAVWHQVNPGTEPALIVGPDYEAGQIAAMLPGGPPVLIHANPVFAPWIDRNLADDCGALVVLPVAPNPDLPLSAVPWGMSERVSLEREVLLQWRWRTGAEPLRLRIAVIAPLAGAGAGACPADRGSGR